MFGIGTELKMAIKKRGIMDQLEAHVVCRKTQDIIRERISLVGGSIKVVKYLKSTKTIEIEVKSIGLGHAIRTEERRLLKEINQEVGKVCIQKIRYRLA